jgi:hypothetical protein
MKGASDLKMRERIVAILGTGMNDKICVFILCNLLYCVMTFFVLVFPMIYALATSLGVGGQALKKSRDLIQSLTW